MSRLVMLSVACLCVPTLQLVLDPLTALRVKTLVIERQYKYNNDFADYIQACGLNASSALCAQKFDDVFSLFCPQHLFLEWNSPAVLGESTTSLTTLAFIYQSFPVFIFHLFGAETVTNAQVKPYSKGGVLYGNFSGLATLQGNTYSVIGDPSSPLIQTQSQSWYHNIYIIQDLATERLCVSRFVTATVYNQQLAEPAIPDSAINFAATSTNAYD